jgi:hypothetical protein
MNKSTIPLDVASYSSIYARDEFHGGSFAAPPNAYACLSHQLIDSLVDEVWKSASDPEHRVSALCVIFDIYMELQRVARIAIDLENVSMKPATPIYDPQSNPLLNYICTGEGESTVEKRAFELTRHSTPNGLKDWLRSRRRDFRLVFWRRQERTDFLSRGPLIDQYLGRSNSSPVDMLPYSLPWKEPGEPGENTRHLAERLVDVSCNILKSQVENPMLLERVQCWSLAFVRARLNRAYSDYCVMQKLPINRFLSPVLLTGAPKAIGRLISHFYQASGRQVIRFAHGGERAFYDDYYWGICELPFCTRYFGHGYGEAINLHHRVTEKRLRTCAAEAPLFSGLGSARHQEIYEKCHSRRGQHVQTRQRRIMFLALSLLGERLSDSIAVKSPDVQSLDLEANICHSLKRAGYHVTFKLHPRIVDGKNSIRNSFGDTVSSGFFDATTADYDCLIFDYAGSAFFDALASNTGVVLIDTGVRSFDANARLDLGSRCQIVSATCDQDNRFRIDYDTLVEAVETASETRECPEEFYQKYFCGDDS